MHASRLLPSAAFAVAVSFFFVPPVLSLAGVMAPKTRAPTRLDVRPVPERAAQAALLKPSAQCIAPADGAPVHAAHGRVALAMNAH